MSVLPHFENLDMTLSLSALGTETPDDLGFKRLGLESLVFLYYCILIQRHSTRTDRL
jgi:hypothetical protein